MRDEVATKFVYTSDTGFTEDLFSFAKHVDLLLLESSFRSNKPGLKHLELAEAMLVARETEPGKLVVTHLYPEWDGIDLATDARAFWTGDIIEAVRRFGN